MNITQVIPAVVGQADELRNINSNRGGDGEYVRVGHLKNCKCKNNQIKVP